MRHTPPRGVTPDLKSHIGRNMADARTRSGLSLASAANVLRWPPERLAEVERGEGDIDLADAVVLSACYGAGLSEFFDVHQRVGRPNASSVLDPEADAG